MSAPRSPRFGPAAAFALAAVAAGGCVDTLLLPPDPADDPETNFELLWTQVDRSYSFFGQKGIDWDSLYAVYRPRVDPETGDTELFGIMAELLDHLEDGHVNLWTPVGEYRYTAWWDRYPANFDPALASSQVIPPIRRTASRRIEYGLLTADIGYIRVPGFDASWSGEMDEAMAGLDGVKALVIDVRDNGGGTTDAVPDIVGRFVDRRRVAERYQYRDGPGHDDFSPLIDGVVEPRGTRFVGPVAVLTNRRCFSTTEDFLMGVRVVPTMFTVGDTTGGGRGNPIHRELPNGWIFRISRWRVFFPDGTPAIDGVGLPPDYPVQQSGDDTVRGVDSIIAAAVSQLEERLAAAPGG